MTLSLQKPSLVSFYQDWQLKVRCGNASPDEGVENSRDVHELAASDGIWLAGTDAEADASR